MAIVFLVTLITDSSLADLVITATGGGLPLLGELVLGEELGSMMWDRGKKIPVHAHVWVFISALSHISSQRSVVVAVPCLMATSGDELRPFVKGDEGVGE